MFRPLALDAFDALMLGSLVAFLCPTTELGRVSHYPCQLRQRDAFDSRIIRVHCSICALFEIHESQKRYAGIPFLRVILLKCIPVF